MRIFGAERIGAIMSRLKVDDETPIEHRVISKGLEGAQKKIEGFNFDSRKDVVKYDDVMNRHRMATYSMRSEILKQADISKRVNEFINSEAKDLANSPHSTTDKYEDMIKHVFPFDDKVLDKLFSLPAHDLEKELIKEAHKLYENQQESFGEEILRKIERDIYLQTLDNYWMEHLENMQHLREGIVWMSVGQRDPLVEYRRQSQIIFEKMQTNLRHDVVRALFHARPIDAAQLDRAVETELTKAARKSVDNADKIIDAEEFTESDFKTEKQDTAAKKKQAEKKRKSRKAERQRRKKGRR